jgi:hypothetical protein
MVKFVFLLLVGLSLVAQSGGAASAAVISWGSPQTISGDSDVSTSGSLVYAYTIGGPGVEGTTVNGVLFGAIVFPAPSGSTQTVTVGSVTFTESPGFLWGVNTLGTGTAPYGSLSGAY